LAAHARQFGLGQLDLSLVWPRINDEQHIAFGDQLAFFKLDLIDIAADPRAQFDGLRRLDPTAERSNAPNRVTLASLKVNVCMWYSLPVWVIDRKRFGGAARCVGHLFDSVERYGESEDGR